MPVDHRRDLTAEAGLARAALAGRLPGARRKRNRLGHSVSYTLEVARSILHSIEQGAHRLVAVLVPDRLRHQARDRQDLQPLEPPLLGIRIVLATTTSSISDARSRSTAGPDKSAAVANA